MTLTNCFICSTPIEYGKVVCDKCAAESKAIKSIVSVRCKDCKRRYTADCRLAIVIEGKLCEFTTDDYHCGKGVL